MAAAVALALLLLVVGATTNLITAWWSDTLEEHAVSVYIATGLAVTGVLVFTAYSAVASLPKSTNHTPSAPLPAADTPSSTNARPLDSDPPSDTLLKDLVRRWPLPRIADVNPFDEDIGVFHSEIADRYKRDDQPPPYIPRDRDEDLEAALGKALFVVIVGPSKSGKSRTAFEACRRHFSDHKLILPREPSRLTELLASLPSEDRRPAPTILWLDELERYLEAPNLDTTTIDGWQQPHRWLLAVATIRETEHQRLLDTTGEIGRRAREILLRARRTGAEIRLSPETTPKEAAAALELYPEESFDSGIGEHFAAAGELRTTFDNGRSTCPDGVALVCAAVDWRRTGLTRPVPDAVLRRLYPLYLQEIRPAAEPTENGYTIGLEWATDPVSSSAALLRRTSGAPQRSFRVFDFIIDYLDGATQHKPSLDSARTVLAATWDVVIDVAEPDEAFAVGFAAYSRDNPNGAIAAYQRAMDSGETELAATAAFSLGVLLKQQGELEAAKAAYQWAIDSGVAKYAALAALVLGVLLKEQEDLPGATAAYQRAMDSGVAEPAARAAKVLVRLSRLETPDQSSTASTGRCFR